ncbi:MAG: cysteine methyltransferase [Candidatus Methylumidiphilus alinenensis]|uniref:Cysteine methyltransferase n=1 Tax=Candidatus Methylumidiphilus alinenensis TaxID=2202197 RepID=A0A2W4RGN4_9GAMM|nr:MAG: cysteine methyltransferase [Candidatus Methylumidiphilus alinenensis]
MSESQYSKAVIAAPFGTLLLEASDSHLLNIEVKIETSGLSKPTTPLLLEATRQLNAYFDDPLCPFSLPLYQQGTMYQNRVWRAMSAITLGSVKSYGQLADELHSGARAVAGVCRANRFPVIIPCHRVVAVNGIGGYCGTATGTLLKVKRWLLQHEGYEYP